MMKRSELAVRLREYTAKLREERAALCQERMALEDRKVEILDSPIGDEDFYRVVEEYIDSLAKNFLSNSGIQAHRDRLSYPVNLEAGHRREALTFRVAERVRMGDEYPLSTASDVGNIVFGRLPPNFFHLAMCFYFGEAIKAKLIPLFKESSPRLDTADKAKVGPSMAERRRELATIETREREIDSAIAEIDSELAELTPPPSQDDLAAQQRLRATEAKRRNDQIRSEFSGRNHDELAKRYSLSVADVKAIIAAGRA